MRPRTNPILLMLFVLLLLGASSITRAQDEDYGALITYTLAVSPDGMRIALGRAYDRCLPLGVDVDERQATAIRVLDVQTGAEVDRVIGPRCPLNDLEWSPDGSRLAYAQAGYQGVRGYDFTTGRYFGSGGFGGPESGGVAWSPDGDYYVEFSANLGQVRVIGTATYEVASIFRADNAAGVLAAAWSSDSAHLALATIDRTVEIWDMAQPAQPLLLTELDRPTNVLAWHPTLPVLALGTEEIALVNPFEESGLVTLSGHTDIVTEVRWNPDGTLLATGSLDGTMRVWDTFTASELAQYPVTTRSAAFGWLSDGRLAYAVADDPATSEVELFDIADLSLVLVDDLGPVITSALAVSPDGTRIALGRSYRRCLPLGSSVELLEATAIRIFDVATGEPIDRILGPDCRLNDLEWSPDGTQLGMSVGSYQGVWVYDFAARGLRGAPDSYGFGGSETRGLAWRPDSAYYADFSNDRPRVYIVDSATYEVTVTLRMGDPSNVLSASWSGDGRYLAVSDYAGTVEIWDMVQPAQPQLLTEHDLVTNILAWHPVDDLLALGIEDIHLVDPFTGAIRQTLTGHTNIVLEIRWNPDGTLLATGGLDDTIRVWDPVTGAELAQYPVMTRYPAFGWLDSTTLAYADLNTTDAGDLYTIVEVPGLDDGLD